MLIRLRHRLLAGIFAALQLLLPFVPVLQPVRAADCLLETSRPYRTIQSPSVYYITVDCQKRPIRNPAIFFSHFSSWGEIRYASQTQLSNIPNHPLSFMPWGPRRHYDNGTLLKVVTDPSVYILLNNNQLYHISSEAVFSALGFSFTDILDVTNAVLNQFAKQGSITSISDYERVAGGQTQPSTAGTPVSTVSALRTALTNAQPGDTIILSNGTYNLGGARINTVRAGTASAPITIKAAVPNGAVIVTNGAQEAFNIHHPHYRFEDLHVQVTGSGSYHAYKLDTDGHDAVIRGGKMEIFRGAESGIKGSSSGYAPYPDNLLVENTEIFFREPTTYGVAEGIDAVGVKGWVIRGNTIHGIQQANRGTVAFAVVLKGNSQDSLIENNTFYDNDIAVSIGGTTGGQWFRDQNSTYEHRRAIVRNNTIRNSKDVAIYLERGNDTQIYGNIISGSFMGGGSSSIDVRYPQSTAIIYGNTLDKPVRNREGGTHTITAQSSSGESTLPPASPPTTSSTALSLAREENHGIPGMYGGSFGTADFDADGDMDVVAIGHFRTMYHSSDNPNGGSEELRLYKNISTPGGTIRFELQHVVPNDNGNRGATLDVGDFNGDGRKDFAIEMRNGGNIASFMNSGNWNFTSYRLPFANNSTSLGLVAADVNQDGRDDLVFNSDGGVGAGLWYSWDTSRNVWEAHQSDFSHRITYGGTIAAGDLTGDGYPEIAVGGNSNIPFGSHNCSNNLMYGQAHVNLGGNSGFAAPALSVLSAYGLRVSESARMSINSCEGMDNAQMEITDLDRDGKNDVIIAGSSTGQSGAPGKNGQHYDFAVLFNVNGTGKNFHIWENAGPQFDNGTTNGGPGNLDWPSIAVGDLTGDGYPDIFVQGHRRDYGVSRNPYVFEDIIFVNNGNRTFTATSLSAYLPRFTGTLPSGLSFLDGRTKYVAEGGVAMADFNSDGKIDVLFSGAELPYHTNGVNGRDYNTAETLKTYVLRNMR